MKQLIVFSSLFMMFIFILLQWTANETSHTKRNILINIVETHSQQARQEGYFTNEITASLKKEIESKLYIPQSEIMVKVTNTPKYRTSTFNQNEMISYEVKVPIKKIIAMSSFLGIDDDDNMYWYKVDGEVSSEKLVER